MPILLCLLLALIAPARAADGDAAPARLVVIDPGHFHAALLQKEDLPGISPTVYVYAPLGGDLLAHLNLIAQFNQRPDHPTHWLSRVYAGPDYLDRMLAERPGNIAIFSGRNAGKIEAIQRSLDAGLHVLADKPWIIEPADMPKLERALKTARRKGLAAYDVMTQRYEITEIVQRALVNDPAIFGEAVKGTESEPGIVMRSVHHLLKTVAGQPNLRPAWFFDIRQQGEGITDVGTHLVDLVQWMMSPDKSVDYRRDVHVLGGRRWAPVLSAAEFERVTGEHAYPPYLASAVRQGKLEYFCNSTAEYTFRGIQTWLDLEWKYEAPEGAGDTELAIIRGTRSQIELRQSADEKYRPEVYVVPAGLAARAEIQQALSRRLAEMGAAYPGLAWKDLGNRFLVTIPDALRIGHEAHFSLVGRRFLQYVKQPASLPEWEESFMLAKYYTTTTALERARAVH
jgi:predicted dehydrogenase